MSVYIKLVEMKFGSYLYGTNTPTSDLDLKAVHVPHPEQLLIQGGLEVISQKTKANQHEKNTADDVDFESYSIQKYLELVVEGQTVALDMLFANESVYTSEPHNIWKFVMLNRKKFLSRKYMSFIGYCRQQANKYGIKGSRMGEAEQIAKLLDDLCLRGTGTKLHEYGSIIENHCVGKQHSEIVEIDSPGPGGTKVPMKHLSVCGRKMPYHSTVKKAFDCYKALFDEYGERAREAKENKNIDWKAMSHAVRIGRQAVELLSTGNVEFPRPDRDHLLAIKRGQLTFEEVSAEIEGLLEKVEHTALHVSTLPENPDEDFVKKLVTQIHFDAVGQWGEGRADWLYPELKLVHKSWGPK